MADDEVGHLLERRQALPFGTISGAGQGPAALRPLRSFFLRATHESSRVLRSDVTTLGNISKNCIFN